MIAAQQYLNNKKELWPRPVLQIDYSLLVLLIILTITNSTTAVKSFHGTGISLFQFPIVQILGKLDLSYKYHFLEAGSITLQLQSLSNDRKINSYRDKTSLSSVMGPERNCLAVRA